MIFEKQAFEISAQIERLKERGLNFQDYSYAEKVLSRISFYRLRAYTYPFQDIKDPNHTFTRDIDFESIIQLYNFDKKLRNFIFNGIEMIEIAIRTQIIHKYSMEYGSHWQTIETLYKNSNVFEKHIESIYKEVKRSNEIFIDHYYEKYTDPDMPPSWMSLEVISMGTLAKIFKSLKSCDTKRSVAKEFNLPNLYVLENWMQCFNNIRNICAHHGRMWNRRHTAHIEFIRNGKLGYPMPNEQHDIKPYKLYAVLLAMNYMIQDICPEYQFAQKLKDLIDKCPLDQESNMGFIENWREHAFWN